MNQAGIKRSVEVILSAYDKMLSDITGSFLVAKSQPSPILARSKMAAGSAGAKMWFISAASSEINALYSGMALELSLVEQRKFVDAIQPDSVKLALATIQSDSLSFVDRQFSSIVDKQIREASRQLDTVIFNAIRASNRSQKPILAAYEEASLDYPDTKIRDAIGRRYESRKMIETTLSGELTDFWNLSIYLILMTAGDDTATVSRPGHSDHDAEIMIETYPDLRSSMFHPNSWSFLLPST